MSPRRPEFYARGEPSFGSVWGEEELQAIRALVAETNLNGAYERVAQSAFEEAAAEQLGGGIMISVNSGGSALDIALSYVLTEPTDEVIACPVNFFGVHLAVLRVGARLIFADSSAGGINLDPRAAAAAVSTQTKAVIVTHMNGIPADVAGVASAVAARAAALGIAAPLLIEDAARSMGADLGPVAHALPAVRFYSLHRKKILSTLGEGGLLQTSDAALVEHARRIRAYGLGEGFGTSLRLTEAQAAVGLCQLERLAGFVRRRRDIVGAREAALQEARLASHLHTLRAPGDVPYLHTIRLSHELTPHRGELMKALADHGLGTVIANRPTYQTNELIDSAVTRGPLPEADAIGARLICLPVHPNMGAEDEVWLAGVVSSVCRQWVGG